MFDIGFWELALIGVVALLVVGPDRLPALARTVGLWVGRIRRYVATVRDDIEREIQADELRGMLNKPENLNPLKEVIDETSSTISDASRQMDGVRKQADGLISEDAEGGTDKPGARDETGPDAPTPASATEVVAEAVAKRGNAPKPIPEPEQALDESAEDVSSNEQRSS